ncbi:hypothetical protein GA0115246_111053 [Streptomyces sp. SolWspMP-sol7th]|nr:hypothetical protein GA0115246_111053 [Streptomyces sp. SolWspMP-sol7th]
MRAQALGERGGEVADGAGVGEGGLAAAQLQRGGERPRAHGLHLDEAVVALGELLQRVEVLAEPGSRAACVAARTVADAPAARFEVGPDLGEEADGAADHVRAGASRGQLGEVREVLEGPVAARAASRASVPGREPIAVAEGQVREGVGAVTRVSVGRGRGVRGVRGRAAPRARCAARRAGPARTGSARSTVPREPVREPVRRQADARRTVPHGTSPREPVPRRRPRTRTHTRPRFRPRERVQPPGRTIRSVTTASRGRSRAVRMVVATDSGSIQAVASYSLPSCWWTFACMDEAVRPG